MQPLVYQSITMQINDEWITEGGEVVQALSIVWFSGHDPGLQAAVRRLPGPRVQELHDGGDHAARRVDDGPRAGHHVVTDQLDATWGQNRG